MSSLVTGMIKPSVTKTLVYNKVGNWIGTHFLCYIVLDALEGWYLSETVIHTKNNQAV